MVLSTEVPRNKQKNWQKKTKFDCKSYEDIKHLDDYDTIIYIGALYAGGALGMKKLSKIQ